MAAWTSERVRHCFYGKIDVEAEESRVSRNGSCFQEVVCRGRRGVHGGHVDPVKGIDRRLALSFQPLCCVPFPMQSCESRLSVCMSLCNQVPAISRSPSGVRTPPPEMTRTSYFQGLKRQLRQDGNVTSVSQVPSVLSDSDASLLRLVSSVDLEFG